MKAKSLPKTMKAFERSKFDKDPKDVKEGSKADKTLDKKQFAAVKKVAKKRVVPPQRTIP